VAGWPALSLQAWGRSPATISLEVRRTGGLIAKLQLKWSPEQIAG